MGNTRQWSVSLRARQLEKLLIHSYSSSLLQHLKQDNNKDLLLSHDAVISFGLRVSCTDTNHLFSNLRIQSFKHCRTVVSWVSRVSSDSTSYTPSRNWKRAPENKELGKGNYFAKTIDRKHGTKTISKIVLRPPGRMKGSQIRLD